MVMAHGLVLVPFPRVATTLAEPAATPVARPWLLTVMYPVFVLAQLATPPAPWQASLEPSE